MNNISAIIVVKNNPPHALETIRSIEDWVDEIVIGDIGIEKNLRQTLQKNKKIKIIKIDKEVPYVELIREELKAQAKNDHILWLDPDEVIPDSLKELILKNLTSYDYLKIPRKNLIFGRWIEHSRWWPDYQVRVFKKTAVIWPRKLHTQPQVQGIGLALPAKEESALIHFNYESIDEYISKAMRYAKSEAEEYLNESRDFTVNEAVKKSVSEFIGRYFAHEGYKDGMHGFTLAFLQMMYYLLVYFYYWEKKKYFTHTQSELTTQVHSFFKSGLSETMYWMYKTQIVSPVKKLKMKMQSIILRILS